MPCLSIRFPPAKKAWKSFTTKLQTKLHKLHKSRAIKKPPKNRLKGTGSKPTNPYLILVGRRLKRKRRRALPAGVQRCHLLKAKAEAVYIDKLFKETVPQLVEHAEVEPRPAKLAKEIESDDQPVATAPGTSEEGLEEAPQAADDVWESIGLASPLMQGIDERAEEFITRFRAEMELQEIMARNL
ncbi:hypothetical protein SLA2020_163520 [Shorea laevis]